MKGWGIGVGVLVCAQGLWAGAVPLSSAVLEKKLEQASVEEDRNQMDEIANQDAHALELHEDLEKRTQFKFDSLLRQARLYVKIHERDQAEALYLKALKLEGSESQRKNTYFELIRFYSTDEHKGAEGALAKKLTLYENILEEFPQIEEAPEIYLRMGQIYRELGDPRKAQLNFYNVLNASLNVPEERIPFYKKWSLQARIEIANTHYDLGEYDEARSFFRRLNLLDMNDADRKHLRFRSAYSEYKMQNFATAQKQFETFVEDYPQSHLAPEAHFLLALIYQSQDHPKESLDQVLALLNKEPETTNDSEHDAEVQSHWHYWKKRAGNHLANQFYEEADYNRALELYQAMIPAQANAEWQVPLFYQIGLCFEKLKMPPKARDAYQLLLETLSKQSNPDLAHYEDMSRERLKHIGWSKKANERINGLFEPRHPQTLMKPHRQVSTHTKP